MEIRVSLDDEERHVHLWDEIGLYGLHQASPVLDGGEPEHFIIGHIGGDFLSSFEFVDPLAELGFCVWIGLYIV